MFEHDGQRAGWPMRIAGMYLNDHQVLALAERLRNLGLDDAADRVTAAYYRDAKELELGFEPATLTAALGDSPATSTAVRQG